MVVATIRLALLAYAVALNLLIWLGPKDWQQTSWRVQLARVFWTVAWALYVLHVLAAFHFVHGWSHAEAIRHTEEVSGFGPGIFVSHLFTLVWTLDVLSWWLFPVRYATRQRWLDSILHSFMLFMVFNSTVVFETGWIRWAGAIFLMEVLLVFGLKKICSTGTDAPIRKPDA